MNFVYVVFIVFDVEKFRRAPPVCCDLMFAQIHILLTVIARFNSDFAQVRV